MPEVDWLVAFYIVTSILSFLISVLEAFSYVTALFYRCSVKLDIAVNNLWIFADDAVFFQGCIGIS